MAISYITNALGGTTTTTSFSITLPTTQANDIIILEYTHRGTGDGTAGGTYTETVTKKHSQLYATSAFSGQTWWSRCTTDHAGQTITRSSLTNSCAAILTVYRGCVTTGDPLNDANVIGEQNAAANETQAQTATSTAGAYVVLVVANSPDVAVSAQSCLSLTTFTERAERLSTGGTDTSIAHASGEKATAGNTGAFTWAQTDGASGSWAYALVPLVAVDITVNATGVNATGAVGSLTSTGGATVSATGVASTGAVGTVIVETISPDVTVTPTGVQGTGSVGTVSALTDVAIDVTGISCTGTVGDVEIIGGCVIGVTGVFATGFVGDEIASGTEDDDDEPYTPNKMPYQWTSCRDGRGRR